MVKNKKFDITKKIKKLFSHKWITAAVVAILLIGGFLIARNDKTPNTKNPAGELTVNTQPATEQEKTETEQHKEQLPSASNSTGQNTNDGSTNTGQKKTVKPTVTDISNNSIKAYVSGVFENDGSCTAVFTKDGKTLTKSSLGFENVSYTQCEPINFESGFLSPGRWSVTVKYSSATAEGTSEPKSMNVQ